MKTEQFMEQLRDLIDAYIGPPDNADPRKAAEVAEMLLGIVIYAWKRASGTPTRDELLTVTAAVYDLCMAPPPSPARAPD